MIGIHTLGHSGAERLGWLTLLPPTALLGTQLGWWIVYRGQLEALNGFFANAPAASIIVVVAGMMCPTVTSACGGLMIARRQKSGWFLFAAGIFMTLFLVTARPA
jgi:zinc transporter ZupT